MDSAEFNAFYARTAPSLRGYLRRCLGALEPADDLLQDAFLRFLRSAPGGMGEPQMRGYLFRTADSLLAQHWRTTARRRRRDERFEWERGLEREDGPEKSERVPTATTSSNGQDPVLSERMARAMQRLKPKARRLLWLAYVEALSHREMAEILALREASIRVLLFRARRSLEKELLRRDI